MIVANAEANGLDIDAAQIWLEEAGQAWMDLEAQQQAAFDELATRTQEEFVDSAIPIISGIADDLGDDLTNAVDEALYDLSDKVYYGV